MFKKLTTSSLRPLGMFIFFSISMVCMLFSSFSKDLNLWPEINKYISYATSFENRFYDYRMRSYIEPNFKSKEIVLVDIDDYSLEKIGSWPVPRTVYATLINKLKLYGAKVIAFDVMFSEKSPAINELSPDTMFATAIKNFQQDGRRIFIPYTFAVNEKEALDEAPINLLNDTLNVHNESQTNIYPQYINRYTFPIEELVNTEVGLGYIDSSEDPDGVFRHYQIMANVDDINYGALGFLAFEAFIGKKHKITIYANGDVRLPIDEKILEINQHGEMKVRYAGGKQQFPHIPLFDVTVAKDDDTKMRELFNGKLVFLGSTALGAHDLRNTPIDAKMPGVFVHMNTAHMLLHKYFFQPSTKTFFFSFLILCFGTLLFIIVQKLGNAFIDAGVTLFMLSFCYVADKYYFLPQGYDLYLFYCFFCFTACYMWNTFLKFNETNKEKKQIRGTFARYVAPTIVDEMLKNPELLHVGGTKKDITCLFSDVRDFTKISEGMSATELAHSLNIYMGAMTDIVFDTKGTLDKYIGDAIVAIWGAPLEIGNHAQYAVEGAIKMMEILPDINEKFIKLGRPVFNVGIGLNSGECSVGNMGSARIFSYTALGDNMNLGARLEGLCKYYGTQILITEMTLARLDLTHIKTRPIDKVIVKGKTTAVVIHEVLHPHHWMAKDSAAHSSYLDAINLFEEKNFIASLEIFNMLLMVNSQDKPTIRYSDICQKYLDHPELVTETFDITTMTEK